MVNEIVAETRDTFSDVIDRSGWPSGLLHALPVTGLVLCLFFYWFTIADRYVVFLYYHDMGSLYPDTSPFSFVTSSRYWMAGLVAGGAVMVLYVAANWVLARSLANYRSPAAWRVWALCALPLLIGIPLITMTANQPTLRPANAAQTTLAALIGLALALLPGSMAAERPGDLAWLALDGMGLMLVLVSLIGLEHFGRWMATGKTLWVWMTVIVPAAGVLALLVISGLRTWRRTSIPSAGTLIAAGLCVAYLFMPLCHYFAGADRYHYISDSDNFFARNGAIQLVTWFNAAILAVAVTRLRERFSACRAAAVA